VPAMLGVKDPEGAARAEKTGTRREAAVFGAWRGGAGERTSESEEADIKHIIRFYEIFGSGRGERRRLKERVTD
jgi:hypothetical protein